MKETKVEDVRVQRSPARGKRTRKEFTEIDHLQERSHRLGTLRIRLGDKEYSEREIRRHTRGRAVSVLFVTVAC